MRAERYINEWVHKITPYTPGKTIEGMTKLASNENSYGPSPKVVRGLREALPDIFRYPYKNPHVKEKLAKYCRVKSENIVLGNGSDEMIELIIKTFKGPIASHYPTFASYRIFAQIHDRGYLQSSLEPDFSFNAERFIRETRDANLIFLCSPNNPTGTLIPEEDIEEVAKTGKIVIVDEAYYEFSGITVKNLVHEYPNLIVMRTLAKAFGLAGLRMGYAIAAPELAEAIRKVRAPFSVNYLAHEAALLALEDLDYMKRTVSRIVTDRKGIGKRLSEKYRVIPSHTNFILVDVRPRKPEEFAEKLLGHRIVVRPQPDYAGFEGSFVRITVGTSEENYRLLNAIERI